MKNKRKIVILLVLVAMVLTLGGVGYYYWYNNTYYVSTDNAQVTGDFQKVTPQASGKLLEFNVNEGDKVVQGQIIGRIETTGLPDSSVDLSLLRAPISGLVVKTQGNAGDFTAAGSTLALLIDPAQLYITANIEETKLNKVQAGQQVDVTIDQYGGQKFTGKVESIGQAANTAFSLLPSSTGGTFTKVVQTVPVKIELEHPGVNLLPATNAEIRIHVK